MERFTSIQVHKYYSCLSLKLLTVRVLFLVISSSLIASPLIWIQLAVAKPEQARVRLEVKENKSKQSYGLKYILLWNAPNYAPFYFFGEGQRAFIQNNCSVSNCYVTSGKEFFGGDITKFDAIAFNGRRMKSRDLPKYRSVHQKFIFFNMESADNYPVCDAIFDDFFNWTSTYRLDSDVPIPYLIIRNSDGEVIGPKSHMEWSSDFSEISHEYSVKLMNKSKAAAWFVSNCSTRSRREDIVKRLQKALMVNVYTLDIYGNCGTLKCPREQKETCGTLLESDYFFYLSFENSFAKDYVTEKLLTALQHDVVPIVYGGADYSRFLPPGSFLDANKYSVQELALIMGRIMKNPKLYQQFFRWKSQLTYSNPSLVENVCAVCEALNQEKYKKKSVYPKFRQWWNPNFQKQC